MWFMCLSFEWKDVPVHSINSYCYSSISIGVHVNFCDANWKYLLLGLVIINQSFEMLVTFPLPDTCVI